SRRRGDRIILGDGDTAVALRKRIHDEAAIHKRVSTTQPKHLIQFIDAVDDERGLMLVSEYYPSTSLEDLLVSRPDALDERQALGIVAATAKGLAAIHDAGVVHRDLKPSNVLLGEDGGLKICDFGLSALIESQDSLSLGSVRYMAPELLRSEPADQRADLYSLGIMAYEMLAGRANFDTAFRNVLRDQRNQAMRWMKWHTNARLSAPPLDELMPDLPPHLVQLVARMMDKDQARRVGSAGDVLDAIRRHFVGDGPEEPLRNGQTDPAAGPVTSTPGDTAPLPSRNKLPLILAGLLVFWVAVGLSLYVISESKKSAAQQRAVAEADALIAAGNRDYAAGNFEAALENYRLVSNAWPDETAMGQKAQLGVLKTRGRLAFIAEDFDGAVDYLDQYTDAGGSAPGIEDLKRDAKSAKAFTRQQASVLRHVEAGEFREAQQVVKDARQTQLTTDETNALDERS
ncbi:MAG: serine/threonine-protein kinase, partial [Planctomycetota bacterium]